MALTILTRAGRNLESVSKRLAGMIYNILLFLPEALGNPASGGTDTAKADILKSLFREIFLKTVITIKTRLLL